MFEPLFITDMTVALLAIIAAALVGKAATGDAHRLRRWLRVTAALVVLRVSLAFVILTGGLTLADSRLFVQVPLAVLPLAWALWRPAPTSAHVGAGGVLLSGWWLFVPFGPQDTVAVLVGSGAALVVVGMASTALGGWRQSDSRAAGKPWLATAFLLVPGIALTVLGQANAAPREHGGQHGAAGGNSVEQLTGPRDRAPDVRVTLTAARGSMRLASGHTVDALMFNGISPGPEIRAKLGQLVEVTLVNTDVAEGVTLHWHGVDVPNAEDGVPGVTQNAVWPGGRHVYRFVPNRTGTFWYHSHRDALNTVRRGLFGALVIDDGVPFAGVDRTVFTHRWPGGKRPVVAFDRVDQPTRQVLAAGRKVLLRVVNSSQEPHRVHFGGTAFTVAAIDGNTTQGATPIREASELLLAAGGRYDLAFVMPDGPVTLSLETTALVFSERAPPNPPSAPAGCRWTRSATAPARPRCSTATTATSTCGSTTASASARAGCPT